MRCAGGRALAPLTRTSWRSSPWSAALSLHVEVLYMSKQTNPKALHCLAPPYIRASSSKLRSPLVASGSWARESVARDSWALGLIWSHAGSQTSVCSKSLCFLRFPLLTCAKQCHRLVIPHQTNTLFMRTPALLASAFVSSPASDQAMIENQRILSHLAKQAESGTRTSGIGFLLLACNGICFLFLALGTLLTHSMVMSGSRTGSCSPRWKVDSQQLVTTCQDRASGRVFSHRLSARLVFDGMVGGELGTHRLSSVHPDKTCWGSCCSGSTG